MFGAILKGFVAVGTKMLIALGSEKLIEWALFYLADQITKSTKTPHDDKWLVELKAAYKGQPAKKVG